MKRIVPICLLVVAVFIVIRVFAVDRVIPSASGGDLVLRWSSATGEVYVVLWTDELSTNTLWTALVTNHPAATGTNETTFTHTGALLDNTGGMMLLSGGMGSEKLAVHQSVVKAQATNVWKSAPLPYWVNILKEYKMPEPPWDEKEQHHLWKTYPSIMPEPPWDKWDHQYVEWVHQWNLHSMKIIEEGPAEPALQLMGLLEGVPQRGFYRVLERREDSDADLLPDWWEFVHFGTLSKCSAMDDPDGDDIRNLLEHYFGLDPHTVEPFPSPPLPPGAEGQSSVSGGQSSALEEEGGGSGMAMMMGGGLRLTGPVFTNGLMELGYADGPTNVAWDLYSTTNLSDNIVWQWHAHFAPGVTNIALPVPSDETMFFLLGFLGDADGDGLSDDFETNVLGTNPQNADTDGDGLSDGYEHYSSQTDPLVANSPPTLQSVVIPFCAIP